MEFHGRDLRQTLRQATQTELDRRQIRVEKRFIPRRVLNEMDRTLSGMSFVSLIVANWPWKGPIDRVLGEHYLRRRGTSMTLSGLGILGRVQSVANSKALRNFRAQILRKAKRQGPGPIQDDFDNSYDFKRACWSLGWAQLKGVFTGHVRALSGGRVHVSGIAHIHFHDRYQDPASIEQALRNGASFLNRRLAHPFRQPR